MRFTKFIFYGLLVICSIAEPSIAQTGAVLDNEEMSSIFNEDQSARRNTSPAQYSDPVFAEKMIREDRVRRSRVLELLKQGRINTGEDYYDAAFIFQHGEAPADYLMAHTLAIEAVAKGRAGASWIAAATLDRYLMQIGQKQIYGTQVKNSKEAGPTMEPYDRGLIPDSVRQALGVPIQAQQDDRLLKLRARLSGVK